MALENPQFPPYQDRGASKPGTSPHLPEGQVSTGIGTITRPADISPSLAEAAAEGTIATVTKTASVGGLSLGKALLIGTPLLGVVAGGVFALSQDRNPSAHPVDNAPVSDTFKPPEGESGVIIPSPQSPDNPSVSTPSGTGPDGLDNPPQLTPEAKIVGNDSIMPAELSTTGVMREFEYQGQVYKLALYNLTDGTPITAPKDGYFVAREKVGTPFIGSSLSVFNPVDLTVPNIGLRGSLKVVNRLSRNVNAGQIVAYIQDTGEKMFGEYNFGVLITTENSTGTGFISPDAPYKEYLPDLPEGPRIVQTQPIQSSSGNVYLPKEK